ncbi:MAG TPA: hypothetical protein VM032_08290 [Vicinamibacterales bacterium]|nr:hypothetical protein [Vicinamibacterales bacterium]
MIRIAVVLALLAGGPLPAQAADERSALARARQLYNMHDFDGAIAAAEEAGRAPERADSADLITARALLERFRASASPDDLTRARERLRGVAPERLAERERLEYVIGLGEALYLDQAPGAAAAVFDSILLASEGPLLDGRELVLDWWASSVDEDARPRTEFERQAMYQAIRSRMREELGRRPTSAAAQYWSIAAARGQGDLQGAWDAARAGWVRAPLAPDHGAALRGDIDRLVQRAIIPERARAVGQPPETLREEWESFKEKWNR